VSDRYLTAIRSSHVNIAKAVHRNLVTGDKTTLSIEGGDVTITSTSRLRRSLSLTVTPSQDTWAALDTVGGEITLTKTLRYIDGTTETVPLGVFIVDQDAISHNPDGTLTLTCPDRWLKVQRNGFGLVRSSHPSNTAHAEIQRLVEDGYGTGFPGWAQLDTSATDKVGVVLYDGDRDAAIGNLCTDNSLQVFFDAQGKAVLRPTPVLTPTSPSVWLIDAGTPDAVLKTADRSRDRSSVHNVILVDTSATDVVFPTQEVKLDVPGDPLSIDGPLGYVPIRYESPTLRNSAQARAAGRTQLYKELGVAKQLSVSASRNDALDADDVIRVALPRLAGATRTTVELHILDELTTPLMPDDDQTYQTRSTRPDTDGA
jgi:hypothetical protein